jgi:hypothetical protein
MAANGKSASEKDYSRTGPLKLTDNEKRDIIKLLEADKPLPEVWRWIETGHRNEVSLRDIHQALKGSFPHAADVKSAIDVLVERGYVELTEVEAKTTGRRPSPIVIIRPDIVEGWS